MQLLFSEPCNLHFGLHAPRTLTIDRSDGPLISVYPVSGITRKSPYQEAEIHGSPREKSYAKFSLHSYIPLQAGAKVGRTREISVEVVYLLVQ